MRGWRWVVEGVWHWHGARVCVWGGGLGEEGVGVGGGGVTPRWGCSKRSYLGVTPITGLDLSGWWWGGAKRGLCLQVFEGDRVLGFVRRRRGSRCSSWVRELLCWGGGGGGGGGGGTGGR